MKIRTRAILPNSNYGQEIDLDLDDESTIEDITEALKEWIRQLEPNANEDLYTPRIMFEVVSKDEESYPPRLLTLQTMLLLRKKS